MSSSVWTTIAVSPDVVTIGLPAVSMPASATASRSSSAVSWVTSDESSETVILRAAGELDAVVEARAGQDDDRAATMTAETVYQSHFLPTKSIERRPL